MQVYLDNAATTPVDPEVIKAMFNIHKNTYGNPSSIHRYGRYAKVAVENARKNIAGLLNCSTSEIIFNSGATEANNTVFYRCIFDLKVFNVITSPLEHHSVLRPLQFMEASELIKLSYVKVNPQGKVDLQHLEQLLKAGEKTLVSLMHANNEIGNLLPMKDVSKLCRKYNALFHSDTAQTIGHYNIDFQTIDIDFAVCSAHKFHGSKGTGFLYQNTKNIKIDPLFLGGAQEMNMRAGTENIAGIVGLSTALEIAHQNFNKHQEYIGNLKSYTINKLQETIRNVYFLGESANKGLYTILNIALPNLTESDLEMLLINLDIEGIAVSSGSACSSETIERSHVVDTISGNNDIQSIRVSLSKYNTTEEIDYFVDMLKNLLE